MYNSGWRPAYGWLGIAVSVFHFILMPIVVIIADVYGIVIKNVLDVPSLTALLTTVVAIAGMRSYDKSKKGDGYDR